MDERDKFSLYERFASVNQIDADLASQFDVKRGLRNADGTGVVAGMTNISNVHGYVVSDGIKIADTGSLKLRGYELYDLLGTPEDKRRYAFEELAYLLIAGELPTQSQLDQFIEVIDGERELPDGFAASHLLTHTPNDVMNMLARSVLELYAADPDPEDRSPEHEIHTALSLLSRLPRIMVFSHYAVRTRHFGESMIMHRFVPGESTAETILSMLRPDRSYTADEARVLDIMMCLHAEHGGGNNSTFANRVLTSADTDPYSAYAGAIGSLKGRRHGGANLRVRAMQAEAKEQIADWTDDDQVADYLTRVVKKEAFDKTGLIYGMGHAVYTTSDPRAVVCKSFARSLAAGTEYEAELDLIESIERLAPQVLADVKGSGKDLCANVDMYSGFVYAMMGIPEDIYTPLFACARMAGWAAHRFEEIACGRIIRPAYKSTFHQTRPYKRIEER